MCAVYIYIHIYIYMCMYRKLGGKAIVNEGAQEGTGGHRGIGMRPPVVSDIYLGHKREYKLTDFSLTRSTASVEIYLLEMSFFHRSLIVGPWWPVE